MEVIAVGNGGRGKKLTLASPCWRRKGTTGQRDSLDDGAPKGASNGGRGLLERANFVTAAGTKLAGEKLDFSLVDGGIGEKTAL